ncbi:PucR family transcriptional regulator [Rhodococcus sp. NPDC003382]|uniref:PucR family transcriptional regulator n=1 Tax=unclassified Rhodococcus (in: high G+C Gram-positive bacteria) TaxID=192944 RepID=UPI0018CD0201|nr:MULTISPECIES: helix-turn-helix domain-containing protein [unclassified Rhodococcus (in: high G+C Gram-positive bacteria)]MBH0121914.1 helix-turn-helix domain-containing protein [Rhodococcus sp. CX]MCK8671778.1 helix-turn-helix domain-containing protein [Rhodococcus sp. HM1]
MEPSPRLTVRGLLEEPLMAGARVAPDGADLDRVLSWILPLGEVVGRYDDLAGVAVYVRPEALAANAHAMPAVAARGAAALVVDGALPAAITSWPPGLPVVELDLPVGFAALNRLLAERSLMQEVHVMRYSAHVHSTLAGLLHRGAGLTLLIKEVSSLAQHPAVALDARGQAVAYHGIERTAVREISERLHDSLTGASAAGRGHHDTRVIDVTAGDVHWTCTASTIRLGKRFEGWVVVLASGETPNPHDLAQHAVVTEQATAIIGSEMLRQRSVDEAEERARGDFVQALVHGDFSSRHDMQARAEYHDIDLTSTFAVFVAPGYVENPNVPAGEAAGGLLRLARYAASVLPHPSIRSYVTVIGDVLVVVRSLRYRDARDVEAEITEFAEAVSEDLSRRRGRPVPVAHGAPAVGADQIRESYRQARVALGIGQRMGMSGSVSYYDLRGYGVLELVAETDRSRRFVGDVLGSLRPGSDLYDTLVAYLGSGGNVNAAARELNVHRNTMLSKLDRISRAMAMDVRTPENQFTAWLAVRLELLDRLHTSVEHEINYR